MADNVAVTPGNGEVIAADEIAGVKHQRVKTSLGADGSATDALGGSGPVGPGVQRVTLASDDALVSLMKSGGVTRTAVASATASTAILAANAARKGATIYNSDANALLLDLSGGVAAATRCQVRLATGQSYEVGSGYTGAITGIWEADGAGQADVVEFT